MPDGACTDGVSSVWVVDNLPMQVVMSCAAGVWGMWRSVTWCFKKGCVVPNMEQ